MNLSNLYSEISKIENTDINNFTRQVVRSSPEASWRMPSSRDHHMRDECGEWGNLIHTLRVVKICDCLSDILDLPQIKRDILKAAAILHDSCKHGVTAEAVWIYKEHPFMVTTLIELSQADCVHKNKIISIIEKHMGRWGNPPIDWDGDDISSEFLLHAADCIEARLDQVNSIGASL